MHQQEKGLAASVLIVDQPREALARYADALLDRGYQVQWVSLAEVGQVAVTGEGPTLILIHLKAPIARYRQMCQQIRNDDRTCDLPIIFLTLLPGVVSQDQIFQMGGTDLIQLSDSTGQSALGLVDRLEHYLTCQTSQQLTSQNAILQRQLSQIRQQLTTLETSQQLLTRLLDSLMDGIMVLEPVRPSVIRPVSGESDRDAPKLSKPVDQPELVTLLPNAAAPTQAGTASLLQGTDDRWADFTIRFANPIVSQLLNLQTEELIGKALRADQLDLADGGLFALCKKVLITGVAESQECSLGEGEMQTWLQITATPLPGFGVTVTLHDITDRQRAMLALCDANHSLHQLAHRDQLTGLANRRRFDEYLAQEWRRLYREQKPMTLILADIDAFKRYNDALGHQAGDLCIQKVAQVLADVARRPADLVARYGGEEFALLFPGTDEQGAVRIAARVLAKMRSLALPHPNSPVGFRVSLSLGVVSLLPTQTCEIAQLVQTADEALYAAKAAGRDRFVVKSCCPEQRKS